MKTDKIAIGFLFLFLCLPVSIFAALPASMDYYFKQISVNQGLSQSKVTAIECDQRGNIWIGTREGLNKYAEGIVTNYFHQPSDVHSIPSNSISFIFEDKDHELWIGTEKGLVRYNQTTNQFDRQVSEGNPLLVSSAQQLSDGILFGGDSEVFRYHAASKNFTHVFWTKERGFSYRINAIYPINASHFYLGTQYSGIWIYNLNTEKAIPVKQYEKINISAFYVDKKGNLWTSPYGQGVYCHSPSGKELIHFNTQNNLLTNNVVLDIKEYRGILWVATDGGGMNIINLRKKTMEVFKHFPGDNYSLPANSINKIYFDKQYNAWLGSVSEGLIGVRKVYAKSFHDVALGNPSGLSTRAVLCIHEENDSILWIGTDGGGINRFNTYTRTFKHFPNTYSCKVVSIVDYSPHELLLSFFDSGLAIFDKRTNKLTPFVIMNEQVNQQEMNSGKSINLFRWDNYLYILGDCIYRYQLNTHSLERLPQSGNLSQYSPRQLIEKGNQISYFMGANNLYFLPRGGTVFKNIYTLDNKLETIKAVCYDEEGLFWLGTPQGLFRLNINTNEIQQISTNLFQSVTSLLSNKHGCIYIGANNQLFSYIVKENRFESFGESDGIYPNELYASATLLSRNGHLYMGGAGGMIFMNKKVPVLPIETPPIKLSDLLVNGSSILNKLKAGESLTLPYDFSVLELKVLLQEKDIFRRKLYRYRIEGLDTYYAESNSPTLSLRTLPSGDYTIKVQCLLRNGNWTHETSVLTFRVSPPWWRSTPFILILILFCFGTIYSILLTLMRKKENRLFREKKDHEQQMYEDKVKFLINLSHELRTPLTLIYGPIKRLLSLPHPPEDLNNQLTSILRQTKQMKNTIDMVLDVRRMELGYEKLQLVTVHLEAVIREIANDFLNECKARNIVLTVENESQIDFIDLDATKFNVILSNLLSNAIKFSPSEGLIRITMQQENEMVRISVIDQGPGLKDVDLSKLFVRFYQGNHKQSGSGIGLSYSKLLIEMHGGTVEATDQEPTGAKFSFTLPLQAKEGSLLSSQPYLNKILPNQDTFKPEISREITVDTTHYSLLIVENNIEMSDFMRIALTEHFQHIFTAQNGEEALQLVNTHKPDVIVSDLSIPQMNGYELCRVIKSNIQTAHIPFILLSECTDNESVSIGYHLGADAYLPKPFEIELLLALIMKQISNREMLRQRYSGIQAIEGPLNNADEMFLLKFNQIIMHHIADSTLDIQKLCELMGMSRSALYNKVKVLTNMSTKEYLNKARINKATVLLTTTSLSIAEISESLGYIYPRYFSGVFRQYMGVLPSKYRHDAKTEI